MRYLSTTQVGEKWNCSPRWVAELCEGGRIKGAESWEHLDYSRRCGQACRCADKKRTINKEEG